MRLIDADLLKKKLADMWYESRVSVTGISVSELIEKQPTVGEWIPVSERLPETHTEYFEPLEHEQASIGSTTYQISDHVLICDKRGHIFVATCEDDGEGRTYWNDYDGTYFKDVLAWMPLPEPYKGGEDE